MDLVPLACEDDVKADEGKHLIATITVTGIMSISHSTNVRNENRTRKYWLPIST